MGKPLMPRTKASLMTGMRIFFSDLQEWGWVQRRFNPARAFATPPSVRRLISYEPRVIADDVCRVAQLDATVVDPLTPLLSPLELEAMQQRAAELLTTGTLPEPEPGYHSVPWPLV